MTYYVTHILIVPNIQQLILPVNGLIGKLLDSDVSVSSIFFIDDDSLLEHASFFIELAFMFRFDSCGHSSAHPGVLGCDTLKLSSFG